MTAILRDEPPPLRGVAPALERILRRCLEKETDHRFQHARDLAVALESLTSETPQAAASEAPAAGAPALGRGPSLRGSGARSANAHVGLGLADATITELASVKSLLVRPTASVLRFRERPAEPEAAGRELGVDAVVYGSFQRSGSRLRVTVQLVRTADGRSLWGTKIDTSLEDVFQMQDDVSRQIAGALEVELAPPAPPEPPGRREGIGEGARALPSGPVSPFDRHDPLERQRGHRELRAGAGDRPGLRARPARPGRRLHPDGLQHRSGRRLVRARRGDVPPRARPRPRPARGPLPPRAAALEPPQRLGRAGRDARVLRGDRGTSEPQRGAPRPRAGSQPPGAHGGSRRRVRPRARHRPRGRVRPAAPGALAVPAGALCRGAGGDRAPPGRRTRRPGASTRPRCASFTWNARATPPRRPSASPGSSPATSCSSRFAGCWRRARARPRRRASRSISWFATASSSATTTTPSTTSPASRPFSERHDARPRLARRGGAQRLSVRPLHRSRPLARAAAGPTALPAAPRRAGSERPRARRPSGRS